MDIVIMVAAGVVFLGPIGHALQVLHYARTRACLDRRLKDYVAR